MQFNAPGVNEDEIQAASERLLNLAAPYTKKLSENAPDVHVGKWFAVHSPKR